MSLRVSTSSFSSSSSAAAAAAASCLRSLPPRSSPPPRTKTKTKTKTIPPSRRTFLSLPTPPPQHLSATRTLPYPSAPIFDLIADVDSYASFVPYCSLSRVTHWSPPDHHGRKWPLLADLHVGWGGFNEVFTSRLRCVPGVSVEARSDASLSGGSDGGASGDGAGAGAGAGVFKTLETLWSLRPVEEVPSGGKDGQKGDNRDHQESARHRTEVRLAIKFQFANPLYAAVSAAVSDQMASVMIEAFETRVHRMLRPRL